MSSVLHRLFSAYKGSFYGLQESQIFKQAHSCNNGTIEPKFPQCMCSFCNKWILLIHNLLPNQGF